MRQTALTLRAVRLRGAFLARIGATVRNLIKLAARERETQRAIAELQRMNDHILKDLGVERDSIEHAVRYGWRKPR